jgi:hypothetical protein
MPREINKETFAAAAAALRKEAVQARVVDVLAPLRTELAALRKEGRTFMELWRVLGKAGLECSYPTAVRALTQVLSGPVRPLAEARARSRARRAKAKSLPAVPRSLAVLAANQAGPGAGIGAGVGDPYQVAATRDVADALTKTFGPKGHG